MASRSAWAGSVGAEPVAGGAVSAVTGTRSTVPHGQPSSGRGHWSARPQVEQGIVTQPSSQVWWVMDSGAAPESSAGVTGAPHAHGYVGAA
ncbi:hypothetical protein [Streptomyces sp. NPDC060205]|uniref:hypothetical protein n=1 Tax=Streptomyces sp. NPDC060205 TaxID=3347072 RepID=UPI003660A380